MNYLQKLGKLVSSIDSPTIFNDNLKFTPVSYLISDFHLLSCNLSFFCHFYNKKAFLIPCLILKSSKINFLYCFWISIKFFLFTKIHYYLFIMCFENYKDLNNKQFCNHLLDNSPPLECMSMFSYHFFHYLINKWVSIDTFDWYLLQNIMRLNPDFICCNSCLIFRY